jgi:hypothetical protein
VKSLGAGTLEEIITGVCAWYESEKPEAQRDRRENVSHGMCQRHLVEMKAQIQARREAAR